MSKAEAELIAAFIITSGILWIVPAAMYYFILADDKEIPFRNWNIDDFNCYQRLGIIFYGLVFPFVFYFWHLPGMIGRVFKWIAVGNKNRKGRWA